MFNTVIDRTKSHAQKNELLKDANTPLEQLPMKYYAAMIALLLNVFVVWP